MQLSGHDHNSPQESAQQPEYQVRDYPRISVDEQNVEVHKQASPWQLLKSKTLSLQSNILDFTDPNPKVRVNGAQVGPRNGALAENNHIHVTKFEQAFVEIPSIFRENVRHNRNSNFLSLEFFWVCTFFFDIHKTSLWSSMQSRKIRPLHVRVRQKLGRRLIRRYRLLAPTSHYYCGWEAP